MVMSQHRPSILTIDTRAITYNVEQELRQLKQGEEIYAVVKADAYSHGAVEVSKVAIKAGATGLCVSNLDEALELREAGILEPILILGVIPEQYAKLAQEHHLTVTVASLSWLKNVLKARELSQTNPLKIHLKVDTGMHRIGFYQLDEFLDTIKLIKKQSTVVLEGIFTHFATADEQDDTYFNVQVERFNTYLNALEEKPKYIHCANSATALWHKACQSNIIRLGIGMYGVNPSGGEVSLPYPLKPAMSLSSELVFVKKLPAHEKISYGATYETNESEWIGTLPIGYADGWHRHLQGFELLIEGEKCEIVGRICMDQLMIRLPKEYPVGTKVVLIGESNGQKITAIDVAEYAKTISYEVMCDLGNRLNRRYI